MSGLRDRCLKAVRLAEVVGRQENRLHAAMVNAVLTEVADWLDERGQEVGKRALEIDNKLMVNLAVHSLTISAELREQIK